ncbi:hypothetical protein GON05_36080 [Paenibacillus sp. MAH-34]|uniref:Uncharacterized protein n=1 Tax=Paenibacillus anseongense TaxID=2682845 RepID=A0ABW9ULA2_9BACL|nr:hypothetical protein [Paenibacillus anseongense]MVQ40010.1 hypothetical protein [Paenibacillus anseongense]
MKSNQHIDLKAKYAIFLDEIQCDHLFVMLYRRIWPLYWISSNEKGEFSLLWML